MYSNIYAIEQHRIHWVLYKANTTAIDEKINQSNVDRCVRHRGPIPGSWKWRGAVCQGESSEDSAHLSPIFGDAGRRGPWDNFAPMLSVDWCGLMIKPPFTQTTVFTTRSDQPLMLASKSRPKWGSYTAQMFIGSIQLISRFVFVRIRHFKENWCGSCQASSQCSIFNSSKMPGRGLVAHQYLSEDKNNNFIGLLQAH